LSLMGLKAGPKTTVPYPGCYIFAVSLKLRVIHPVNNGFHPNSSLLKPVMNGPTQEFVTLRGKFSPRKKGLKYEIPVAIPIKFRLESFLRLTSTI